MADALISRLFVLSLVPGLVFGAPPSLLRLGRIQRRAEPSNATALLPPTTAALTTSWSATSSDLRVTSASTSPSLSSVDSSSQMFYATAHVESSQTSLDVPPLAPTIPAPATPPTVAHTETTTVSMSVPALLSSPVRTSMAVHTEMPQSSLHIPGTFNGRLY